MQGWSETPAGVQGRLSAGARPFVCRCAKPCQKECTMEEVLTAAEEILDRKGNDDELITSSTEFEHGEELPWKALAVYHSLLILKTPSHLQEMLAKLCSYVDFDMQRKAAIDFVLAKRMIDTCNVADLLSIVATVCWLDRNQLNIIGY